jgi:hypothetical protein
MATTTNYSWTTPDDTDLVKDGAAAIRTLGSAIDTSFAADQGDLLLGGTSDIFEPLAIGAAATVLTSDGTTASWAAAPAASSFNTGYAFTSGTQNTSSSSYVDLSTVTSTTVTTGTKALIAIKSRMGNEAVGAGVWAHCSFAVSGATTIAAADERSISGYFTYAGQWISEVGAAFVVTGLTAGSNTFTLKFNAQGGYATPATFYDRSISVVNLGS